MSDTTRQGRAIVLAVLAVVAAICAAESVAWFGRDLGGMLAVLSLGAVLCFAAGALVVAMTGGDGTARTAAGKPDIPVGRRSGKNVWTGEAWVPADEWTPAP